MRLIFLVVGIILSATLLASESDNLKEYFNHKKVGHSADFGVFKHDTDYVISVHGFDRDLDVCLEIVSMLNQEQPDTYSCKPLNHEKP
ncbi:MAG: hypothetical protein HRT51_11560 [Colwellia sp.]|nr:hypothetical protein [Colwellia sp.]